MNSILTRPGEPYHLGRYHHNDRGRNRRNHVLYVAGASGTQRVVELRGFSPEMEPTEVEERFDLVRGGYAAPETTEKTGGRAVLNAM